MLFIIAKLLQILIILTFLGLVGLLLNKPLKSHPYNSLLTNKCDLANLWANLGAFSSDLRYFVSNPALLFLLCAVLVTVSVYRFVCVFLVFYWFLIYLFRYLLWAHSKELGCFSIYEKKFREAFNMGLFRFFLVHIPECVGFLLVYSLFFNWDSKFANLKLKKIAEILILNLILGTSLWNLVVSCIITRRLGKVLSFKFGIVYLADTARNVIKSLFYDEINISISIARELRMFKQGGRIRFNPTNGIIIKSSLAQPASVVKIFSRTPAGNTVFHPGFQHETSETGESNFVNCVQATGRPVKNSESLVIKALGYKQDRMFLQYNIVQHKSNVELNYNSGLLRNCGLTSVKNQELVHTIILGNRLVNNKTIIYETPGGGKIIHKHELGCFPKGILTLENNNACDAFDYAYLKRQELIASWLDALPRSDVETVKNSLNSFNSILNFHDPVQVLKIQDNGVFLLERFQDYPHYL